MKIIVYGIGGAMGKIVNEVVSREDEVVCGVDKFADKNNFSVPVYSSCKEITEKADCIIDFSVREAIYDYLPYAVEHKIPCVISTTGYDEKELAFIEDASRTIPVFKSGNMSVGINVLLRVAKLAASVLGNQADIEIVETHHHRKVDAPSGTALLLADGIKEVLPDKQYVFGRNGHTGKRKPEELGIHALRGGTVVGKHEISFFMNSEVITVKHEAESRAVFAEGSLSAARFLVGKNPGIYNMNDMLNQ